MVSIRNRQEGDSEFTNHSTVKWLLMPLEATGFFRAGYLPCMQLKDIQYCNKQHANLKVVEKTQHLLVCHGQCG